MPAGKSRSGSVSPVGIHYGKRDMERIGLFSDSSWMHGVPYTRPKSEFREGGMAGRQILSEGSKTRTGLQDCYLEKGPLKRIFEGEATSGVKRSTASGKEISRFFVPAGPGKKHSTPGDYYGTFSGRIEAVSRAEKPRPKSTKEPPNVMTNPGKKGTFGFYDITINKFPEYMPDDFFASYKSRRAKYLAHKRAMLAGPLISMIYPKPCFDMNPWHVTSPMSTYVKRMGRRSGFTGPVWVPPAVPKKPGNNHDGCFSPFPAYNPVFFKSLRGTRREPNVFYPQIRLKSKYTTSTINHNVDFRVNAKNWRTASPFTCKFNVLEAIAQNKAQYNMH